MDDRFFVTRGVEDLVFAFFAGFLAVFLVACFFDGRFAFFAVDVAPSVSRGSSVCVFAFAIISFRQIWFKSLHNIDKTAHKFNQTQKKG
ncbi:MAG: hypothetical protein OXH16_07395 [Gemmatimonadetes bacterium]|nr:hypothetical protein [Gemmatimonadota bacterium]